MRKFLCGLLAALAFAGSGIAADLSQFKTADDLWAHIRELQKGPQQQPQSEEEARRVAADFVKQFDAVLAKFIASYPADARCWDAKVLQVQTALTGDLLENKNPSKNTPALDKLKAVATAKDAPDGARANAAFMLIQMGGSALGPDPDKEDVGALDKEMLAFIKSFPDDPRSAYVKLMRADVLERIDPAKAEAIWKELVTHPDQRVARRAKAKLEQRELTQKPIELKFTAVDGKEVDLTKMRGKVVLVDFWATWCGPCRVEIPNIVAAYKKYHEKGFEIAGISLDEDKEAMQTYAKERGMTWPQHCDGKGWQNEISSRYGIQSIPAMWLVDKKGMIRSTEARGEQLTALIEKLLAE
ncbi:MAG: TlpA family protein disulfide reductase [Verrucomicrobia bacterium]|nr:TlpA family protein disulfide reductase [Verrucomicrobiota bacterium]